MFEQLKNIEKEINNTQVVVLAGGSGSRMDSSTDLPKALLKVGDKPLLYYFIKKYTSLGFKDFKFLLGYKGQDIINYIENENFNINAVFSIEPENIKGKAKAVKYALENGKIDRKKRAFIAFPDDYFFNPNLPIEFLLRHISGVEIYKTFVTICYTVGTKYAFGVSEINSEHIVGNFEEKPFIRKNTNTGLYIVEPEFFDEVEKSIDLNLAENIEIEKSIFPALALKQKIFSMIIPFSFWVSVNTTKELKELREKLKTSNLKRET